jgi:hypothetical protein
MKLALATWRGRPFRTSNPCQVVVESDVLLVRILVRVEEQQGRYGRQVARKATKALDLLACIARRSALVRIQNKLVEYGIARLAGGCGMEASRAAAEAGCRRGGSLASGYRGV